MAKTKIVRFVVCNSCYSIGILFVDCICIKNKVYPQIALDFEVCSCCEQIITDGEPANTPFNIKQIEEYEANRD